MNPTAAVGSLQDKWNNPFREKRTFVCVQFANCNQCFIYTVYLLAYGDGQNKKGEPPYKKTLSSELQSMMFNGLGPDK